MSPPRRQRRRRRSSIPTRTPPAARSRQCPPSARWARTPPRHGRAMLVFAPSEAADTCPGTTLADGRGAPSGPALRQPPRCRSATWRAGGSGRGAARSQVRRASLTSRLRHRRIYLSSSTSLSARCDLHSSNDYIRNSCAEKQTSRVVTRERTPHSWSGARPAAPHWARLGWAASWKILWRSHDTSLACRGFASRRCVRRTRQTRAAPTPRPSARTRRSRRRGCRRGCWLGRRRTHGSRTPHGPAPTATLSHLRDARRHDVPRHACRCRACRSRFTRAPAGV